MEEVTIFCQAKFDQVPEVLKKRKFMHTQCRFAGVAARISILSLARPAAGPGWEERFFRLSK